MGDRLLISAIGCIALLLGGCGRADHQAPAPAESLRPLPSAQPSPPAPSQAATQATEEIDACGAGRLAGFTGEAPTPEVIARIKEVVRHHRLRVIRPGNAVTMDMRPDRLNIDVGPDGLIERARCG